MDSNALEQLRTELEKDGKTATTRLKTWMAIQIILIICVIGYMSWLFGMVKTLDANAVTEIAAGSLRQRLPEMRANIREYLLLQAPAITDEAKEILKQVPALLREGLEQEMLAQTQQIFQRFEEDLDAALTGLIEEQIELVKAQVVDAPPEEQLDAVIAGVSAVYKDNMIQAIDYMYDDYAAEVKKLNDYLDRLQRANDLTETEVLDKQLIQVWMVLVHKHEITLMELRQY